MYLHKTYYYLGPRRNKINTLFDLGTFNYIHFKSIADCLLHIFVAITSLCILLGENHPKV